MYILNLWLLASFFRCNMESLSTKIHKSARKSPSKRSRFIIKTHSTNTFNQTLSFGRLMRKIIRLLLSSLSKMPPLLSLNYRRDKFFREILLREISFVFVRIKRSWGMRRGAINWEVLFLRWLTSTRLTLCQGMHQGRRKIFTIM